MDRNYILNLQGKELNDLVSHEIMGREGDWSESISAAWEVVERMNKTSHRMFAIEVGGFDNPLTIWRCTIKGFGWVEAPTAPEAIAKCALLATMEETP